MGGFGRHGDGERPGFGATLTRLQMQGYVTTFDFEYERDRNGDEYGWGVRAWPSRSRLSPSPSPPSAHPSRRLRRTSSP